ncbi:hypothetical protein RclHR1_24910003 [Rhizophagus clarus]|uniref:Endonuclease/exonuclease/phosphatase domain-containing protein n=1 Tax=Rhizophagus clarus TaxID=94130 RepID=A0A2Z6R301_9GLOM|nr:hypothetical protein RclHR1_24910003 [Rhizophagus clarus]
MAALKEHFHVGQPSRPKPNSRSRSHSHSRPKGPDNSRSSQQQHSSPTKPSATIPHNQRNHSKSNDKCDRSEASKILSLLKALQQDMTDVRERITALELNDQPAFVSSQPPFTRFCPSTSHVNPVRSSSLAVITSPAALPSPKTVIDEIQAINEKHSAIESKMDMLVASISGFIGSINTSSTSNLTNAADIENLSLQESLFSSECISPLPPNSFNISSLNINGLKTHSQNKIEQLLTFFSLKQISFGGVIDTHLHLKQMQFLSKRLSNYTFFSSSLDTSQHIRSSGGVLLFIENSLAPHVHTYTSHSSCLLSVDLYFKGNIKLPLSDTKRLGFHHAICGHLDQFYPIFFNQPQIASKRIHRLFNFLLSSGYVNFTSVNFSASLGTFRRADIITRIDYIWSCPLFKSFLLTSIIFVACDSSLSDHNPVITYFDSSLLRSSIKLAHTLCNTPPITFASWHVNQMCEYLHSSIIAGTTAVLPSRTIFNLLSHSCSLLRGLHLLKEKEYQDFSIKSHIEKRDLNFDTDISFFINSALSHSRQRIMLDCVFIDHPTAPRLLTDPLDISAAVVNHFQHAVPVKSTPPLHISALPD